MMKEPGCPRVRSYKLEMQPGEYWWCACGYSKNQPFCDNSHLTSDTGLKPIKVIINSPQRVKWCGCKRALTKPFCDNTHRSLPGYEKEEA